MTSAALIHIIGTTALLVVLAFVVLHVNSTATIVKYQNLHANYERIASSITAQFLYALETEENITLRLIYPPEAANNEPYNIIIGSGSALKPNMSFCRI
jgi:hypothetical protein